MVLPVMSTVLLMRDAVSAWCSIEMFMGVLFLLRLIPVLIALKLIDFWWCSIPWCVSVRVLSLSSTLVIVVGLMFLMYGRLLEVVLLSTLLILLQSRWVPECTVE